METRRFLISVSTTLHLSYQHLSYLCNQRRRFSSLGGVHYGTFAVLSWSGERKKGGVVDMSVLLGHKDKLEVAFLPSSKVALDRLRVHHQELMALLYGGLVVLDRILGG